MNSYIWHTPLGSYCTVCQSTLGCEEIDWDVCDTCGGEGFGEDEPDGEPENLR